MPREASTHLSRKGECLIWTESWKRGVNKGTGRPRLRRTKNKKTKTKNSKKNSRTKSHTVVLEEPGWREQKALQETLCTCQFGAGMYPTHVLLDTELGPHTHEAGTLALSCMLNLGYFSVFILRQVSLHYQGWLYVTFLWPPEQLGLGACASKLSQFHTHMCFT